MDNHEQKAAEKYPEGSAGYLDKRAGYIAALQEREAPKGVEDAAKKYADKEFPTGYTRSGNGFRNDGCITGFIAGATWQANQLPGVEEWVSVNEKAIPPLGVKFGESEYLLCLTESGEQVVCYFYGKRGHWVVANYKADSLPLVSDVTHWRKLPEPPKGK